MGILLIVGKNESLWEAEFLEGRLQAIPSLVRGGQLLHSQGDLGQSIYNEDLPLELLDQFFILDAEYHGFDQ